MRLQQQIMKNIQVITVIFILFAVQGEAQIRKTIIDQVESKQIVDINKSKKTDELSVEANCYDGSVKIDITNGSSSSLQYVACFAKTTSNCGHQGCYNGWIANYTSQETGRVDGYPGNSQESPIFRLDINSAADFNIKKPSGLSQSFDRLIDIACTEFDPTVATKMGNARLLKAEKVAPRSERQATFIPQFAFKNVGSDMFSAKSAPQQVMLSDSNIEGQAARIDRSFLYNSAKELLENRYDTVNVNFKNTISSDSDQDSTNNFIGKVTLGLNKKGTQSYKVNSFENALNNGKIESLDDIVLKSKEIKLDNAYATVDQLSRIQEKQKNLGGRKRLLKQQLVQQDRHCQRRRLATSKIQMMNLRKEINQYPCEPIDPVNPTPVNPTPVNPTPTASTSSSNLPPPIVFNQNILLSKESVLYERTVLGKRIKASIHVVAKLLNNNTILFVEGTLKLDFFGRTKDISLFRQYRNANFNWQYNQRITGTWGFNFYVPLPPPVHFLGINFGFSATYTVNIKIGANGQSSVDIYTLRLYSDLEAKLDTDATAGLRAVVIEGGVFIRGTLVKVRTDPSVIMTFNTAIRKLQVVVNWYFYLHAFQFHFGFYYKTIRCIIKWFSIRCYWSDMKIIGQWSLGNGIQLTIPILVETKQFNI